MSARDDTSQKVSQVLAYCKGSCGVRDAACQTVSASVRSPKLTVDQEVGGSNPPSCTSARRNFLDKTPLARRAPVALTHSHVSLELPSFPRRGEK